MRTIRNMYTKNYACMGPGGYISNAAYANPESAYWQETAGVFKGYLLARLEPQVFLTWAELTWPGDSINACTWRQISRANEAAFRAVSAGQTDPSILAGISQQAMKETP